MRFGNFRRALSGLLVPDREIVQHRLGFHTLWDVWCTGPDGEVRWAEYGLHNLMPDQGEEWLLQVAFSEEATVPVDFYIGLTTQVATNIDEATTITTVANGTDGTEPSGNGYARQAVPSTSSGWTVEVDSGDYWARSSIETFTASGGAIPTAGSVDWMFLSTTIDATGVLVAVVALSQSRTIADGDSLNTSIRVKASE